MQALRAIHLVRPMPFDGIVGQVPCLDVVISGTSRQGNLNTDICGGAENLTNFRQKNLLIGTSMEMLPGHMASVNTSLPDFDASAVWGPIMGTKVYLGLRYTLWK